MRGLVASCYQVPATEEVYQVPPSKSINWFGPTKLRALLTRSLLLICVRAPTLRKEYSGLPMAPSLPLYILRAGGARTHFSLADGRTILGDQTSLILYRDRNAGTRKNTRTKMCDETSLYFCHLIEREQ